MGGGLDPKFSPRVRPDVIIHIIFDKGFVSLSNARDAAVYARCSSAYIEHNILVIYYNIYLGILTQYIWLTLYIGTYIGYTYNIIYFNSQAPRGLYKILFIDLHAHVNKFNINTSKLIIFNTYTYICI